jgi:hypothetical protein
MRWDDLVTTIRTPSDIDQVKPCIALLCRKDVHCSHVFQGRAYAPLIDSVGDRLRAKGASVSEIALPFSRLVGPLAYGNPHNFHRTLLIELLKAKAASILKPSSAGRGRAAAQVAIWRKILQRSRPRVVIGIMPSEPLCLAGHEAGIPVLDLQHGVISEQHPWYGAAYRATCPPETLPHGFLVWDAASARVLDTWTRARGISVEVIGNPWFHRFHRSETDDLVVKDALASSRVFAGDKPTMLFSMQHGQHPRYSSGRHTRYLPEAVEQLIDATRLEYRWLLRLHPVQLNGVEREGVLRYLGERFGRHENVDWQRASRIPLPALLKQVDLHITDLSSLIIEASWMGVPSAILSPDIHDGRPYSAYFLEQRANGAAFAVPMEAQSIQAWIRDRLQTRQRHGGSLSHEDAFESFIDSVVRAEGDPQDNCSR